MVMVGTPMMRGQIEPDFLTSLLGMHRKMWKAGVPNYLAKCESSLISASRNNIADVMKFDYLMWIDTDIKFPADGVLKLMKHNLDIVGGVVYYKFKPYNPAIHTLDDEGFFVPKADFPQDKIFEVDGIGCAFVLIKKRVLQAFTEEIRKDIGQPYDLATNPKTGLQDGEDLSFCRRVLHLGFKIYADPTIPLGHIGAYTYTRDDFLREKKGVLICP